MKKLLLLFLLLIVFPENAHTPTLAKKILKNGLTVLVCVRDALPRVVLNMVLDVGSSDEETNEKGIAHLIEHMFFKGTKSYSESDINHIVHKLSGTCNASTSYDTTRYWFEVPSAHWKTMLPVMAELLSDCTFDDEHLNSEFKAVLQELKMGRDNYARSLFAEMRNLIFSPHPYHHPIIGYKQDIWNLHGSDLARFYKKHYHPNNAVLVVVGDVDPDEVFALCEQQFAHLHSQPEYKRASHYLPNDIVRKTVTLYRDVTTPFVINTYVLPAQTEESVDVMHLLPSVLGLDTNQRISRRLIDQEQLVTSCSGSILALRQHSMLCVTYRPKHIDDKEKIDTIIEQEIATLVAEGINLVDIQKYIQLHRASHYDALQSNRALAEGIGAYAIKGFAPERALQCFEIYDVEHIQEDLTNLLCTHVRPSLRHQGVLLPLTEDDKQLWQELQHTSDEMDHAILQERLRISPIEAPRMSETIKVEKLQSFSYPKPQQFTLLNNLAVLHCNNTDIPKIELKLDLLVNELYDPVDKEGLCEIVFSLLDEGTKKYSRDQLVDLLESHAINIAISAGSISMSLLKEDLPLALDVMHELLTSALFEQSAIDKIRTQLHANVDHFWDNPNAIAIWLACKQLYSSNRIGTHITTHATLNNISREDIVTFYKKYCSPDKAVVAIVGDCTGYNIEQLVHEKLGSWQGETVTELSLEKPIEAPAKHITHTMNRDQVALYFAGLSVNYNDKDYHALRIFDQIFSSGALHSMQNRLFALREQTGIFYSPQGSVVMHATSYKGIPGMVYFGSLISKDRLQEAEELLKNLANTVAQSITQQELEEAKRAIITSTINTYETNSSTAITFLRLARLERPFDYYDRLAQELELITLEDVQEVARTYLDVSRLSVVKVGRV